LRIFSITDCQGTEALAFARNKRSSGPFVSGLTAQDGYNDLELTAAVLAVLHVDLESEALAQTKVYASNFVAKTLLSFTVVGKPVLRMTAFQVPEGVLTKVGMVVLTPSKLSTVPKLYRKPSFGTSAIGWIARKPA
jgi:hypothetical protein